MTTQIKRGMHPGQECLLCHHVIPQPVPGVRQTKFLNLQELMSEPPRSIEECVADKLCVAIFYLLRKHADIAEDIIENAIEMLHGGPDLS